MRSRISLKDIEQGRKSVCLLRPQRTPIKLPQQKRSRFETLAVSGQSEDEPRMLPKHYGEALNAYGEHSRTHSTQLLSKASEVPSEAPILNDYISKVVVVPE